MSTEYPSLPKWPGLLVAGDPVDRDQAAEIIIRTTAHYLSCNEKHQQREIVNLLGMVDEDAIPYGNNEEERQERLKQLRAAWDRNALRWEALKAIPLSYLHNSRLMSCWIGGTHGWCNWDGTIFANSFNIGKWPTVEEVEKDWQAIAAAFPFLNLRSQLLNRESSEAVDDGASPIVEFVVRNGQVEVKTSGLELLSLSEAANPDHFVNMVRGTAREICDEVHFPIIARTVARLTSS